MKCLSDTVCHVISIVLLSPIRENLRHRLSGPVQALVDTNRSVLSIEIQIVCPVKFSFSAQVLEILQPGEGQGGLSVCFAQFKVRTAIRVSKCWRFGIVQCRNFLLICAKLYDLNIIFFKYSFTFMTVYYFWHVLQFFKDFFWHFWRLFLNNFGNKKS